MPGARTTPSPWAQPGRDGSQAKSIQGVTESSHCPRPTHASVARRDSRCLLPHLAPPPNHRRQSSQGFVDRDAVREDVKDIVSDHNDIRTFGISRRGSAACRPGEIIFWAHRIVLAGIASMVVLHISFSPFWLLLLRRRDASMVAARQTPRQSVVCELTCRATGNVPPAANDPDRSSGVPVGRQKQLTLRRMKQRASEHSTVPFRYPNRIRTPSRPLSAGGFRGHDTFLITKDVKAEWTSTFIAKNIAGPGRKSRRARSARVSSDQVPVCSAGRGLTGV